MFDITDKNSIITPVYHKMSTQQGKFRQSGAPRLPKEVVEEISSTLKTKLKDLVFRRVGPVITKDTDLISVNYFGPEGQKQLDPATYKRDDYSSKEYEQNIEENYSKFFFFTTQARVRDNDQHPGEQIFCASNYYSQLDFTDSGDLEFSKKRYMRTITAPPRPGDLVCLIPTRSTKGRKNLQARFWFTCSEQFLRAWTLIMYFDHDSFEAHGEEPRMREMYFSGNRLTTNNYKKWEMACKQAKMDLDLEEANKRYFHLRTEHISRRFLHVYAALVLMTRYKELPCKHNVPVVHVGPTVEKWNLPRDFVSKFLRKWTSYDPSTHRFSDWSELERFVYQGIVYRSPRKDIEEQRRRTQKNRPKSNVSGYSLTPPTLDSEEFPSLGNSSSNVDCRWVVDSEEKTESSNEEMEESFEEKEVSEESSDGLRESQIVWADEDEEEFEFIVCQCCEHPAPFAGMEDNGVRCITEDCTAYVCENCLKIADEKHKIGMDETEDGYVCNRCK